MTKKKKRQEDKDEKAMFWRIHPKIWQLEVYDDDANDANDDDNDDD